MARPVAAIVCGRSEEGQTFSGRNLLPVLGRPMMLYPLLAARHAAEVQHVFLSTDSPAIARIAQHAGFEALDRPAHLTGPGVDLEDVVAEGYQRIATRLGSELEALVVLLCNAPTVTASLIDSGVELLRSDPRLEAAISVSPHNEFHPTYALRLDDTGALVPAVDAVPRIPGDVYFPDALLYVLRPESYFRPGVLSKRWISNANLHGQRIAPLVHEGYGDVDYPWQVPLVESWLRRRGFSEEATPYQAKAIPQAAPVSPVHRPVTALERRVLITTVPFGEPDRTPLDLLESARIEYVINPVGRRLTEEELAELAADFGVLIAGTEPITARVMDAAPHLRLISRVGIGLDSVDLLAARDRDIAVSYTPEAPSPAVAELALGLMLNLLRHVSEVDRSMRDGVWRRLMGRRLEGLTVGIIGVGRVGKRVTRMLRAAFPTTRILCNDLAPDVLFGDDQRVQWVDKETIYRQADLITLHLPLTPLTRGLIGAREMDLMRSGALLVNTARGGLIVERDLAEALRGGKIAGAAIDVFEREPYAGELSSIPGCLLTSHMGSMSEDCRARMELEATEEALRFLAHEPLRQLVPQCEYEVHMGAI